MSNLSRFKISFKISKDLKKLIIISYLSALVLILSSSLAMITKIMLLSLLLCAFLIKQIDHKYYSALIYEQEKWFLVDKTHQIQEFANLKIVFNCRLFFLIHLINNNQNKKILTIFVDEVDRSSIKKIFIINKLKNKS